ncbi:MAG: DAK2 domain-containing protein [Clostridiales bacterium]|nr:DAK2 domain-containing protein [Clostridiales bacterium]MDY4224823.1 DAK2 domain-containing protein [Candidatus Limivicinus sp.]
MRNYIDAAAFKEMILCANAALHANVQAINDLNVFPVPDGDTGTNMALTMDKAATELKKKEFDTIAAAADCVASALLRGARGNSGVILSLLFRGISKRLKGLDTAGAQEFAGAMQDGVDAAYKAVMKPAEGTILTVSRMAAAAAVEAANAGAGLESCLDCAIKAGSDALAETVNQNPVLKKAGVIDAGGQGYMYILGAMLASYRGEITAPENVDEIVETEKESSAFDVFDTEDITFAFDTVFIVRKHDPDVDLEPLRKYLTSIGDSLVIGEDDETFKVHVHTNIPGNALNEAQNFGTLELAKIENMRTQHDDILAGKHVQTTDDLDAIERELEESEEQYCKSVKDYGVVTVCAGKGLEGLFKELGADGIVTGGQTMNPSTDDILKEINRTPANTVFVLPNNKNIIMAAEQCVRLSDKKVIIIPTRTVPQGISAMLNFNPEETEENLIAAMNEAAGNVHTAMVTYAARDSDFDGHEIHAGEYLALLDGALLGSYSSEKTLFKELSWAFDELSPEFITVYYGSDVAEDKANEAAETIIGCFPDAEVSVVNGGQPVYYYMISVE